ncbi:hypothetical protein ACPYO6_12475 [Georgenia sp. Z1344]|uniref:hypothetical protein n=1 Tax=Georgenia sp. Z1344 TaxID=3416706 RepID=UPI003CF43773
MTTDPGSTELRRDLRALEARVRTLENALVRLVMGAAGALLVAGLVLPFLRYTDDGEPTSFALAWAGIKALADGVVEEQGGGGILLTTVISLPAVVSILALVSLGFHAAHRDSGRRRGVDVAIGGLLVLSTIGVFFLAAVGSGRDVADAAVGPAVWFYAPGAIAVAWLLGEESARSWWNAGRQLPG